MAKCYATLAYPEGFSATPGYKVYAFADDVQRNAWLMAQRARGMVAQAVKRDEARRTSRVYVELWRYGYRPFEMSGARRFA